MLATPSGVADLFSGSLILSFIDSPQGGADDYDRERTERQRRKGDDKKGKNDDEERGGGELRQG